MSEIKSLAAPKASFDRRSVVKGAAWSVPVIAAAIAAPAAAASVVVRSLTIAGPTRRAELNPRDVKAPANFTIENSGAAIVGPQLFSITVTPTPAAGGMANKMARIGVNKVSGVTVNGSFDNKNAFTGTVAVPGNVALSKVFDLTYSYARSVNETQFGSYSVAISLTSLSPALTGFSTIVDTKVG